MPQLSVVAALQIGLLLSAVPAQYFISRWSGPTAVQRYHATTRLLRIWKEWQSSYFNGKAWTDWANQKINYAKSVVGLDQEEEVERNLPSAHELLRFNEQGYFGASKSVRSPRPPYVFLRVGDVVMENTDQMVGVVVSWDPEPRVPAEWINRGSRTEVAERTPHYKVLFGGPKDTSLLVAYLPQTQLERVTRMRPNIPTLENYFTHFDGERFVMQPWLREIFPEDEISDV